MSITNIYIAANAVGGSGPFGHLQLVAVTDTGDLLETEVQSPGFFGLDWDVIIEQPQDASTTPGFGDSNLYRLLQLNLDGRNPDDVWNVIKQAAADISSYFTPYAVFSNSNSYIKTLMNFLGIDLGPLLAEVMPPAVTSFPGAETDVALRFDDPITYKISGTFRYDFLNGGNGDDVFIGNSGNDRLFGGSGSDTLVGDAGQFNSEKVLDLVSIAGDQNRDILLGGAGFDTYYISDSQFWGHRLDQNILLSDVIPKLDHISDSDALGEVRFPSGGTNFETLPDITWERTANGYADITGDTGFFLMQSGNVLGIPVTVHKSGYRRQQTQSESNYMTAVALPQRCHDNSCACTLLHRKKPILTRRSMRFAMIPRA
jgi:RTX calcium-binding nonapeptide repeat (4 copies)